ncbi:MAG TPA: family 78 glycoside hydrolase catalytic domain [Niabella sp.]|nr:family 78 glycoside hydrolase catalytic domain [Niabella sp.]
MKSGILKTGYLVITLLLTYSINSFANRPSTLNVYDLRCNGLHNPVGTETAAPKFSWKLKSAINNVYQEAYSIRVFEENGSARKQVYNTGKIVSGQSHNVDYRGNKLSYTTRYYWQVKVWDNYGNESAWSDINYWETGIDNWDAKWITSGLGVINSGPAIYYRKTINVNNKPLKARLYITSLGIYEAFINGKRISDDFFAPGWTSYLKRLQYQVYDVTQWLKKGDNHLTVTVGDGWYKGNLRGRTNTRKNEFLLAELRIFDGDKLVKVITDDTWKTSNKGPIRMSDFYDGEYYDAGTDIKGWASAAIDDQNWKAAIVVDSLSYDNLVVTASPLVKKKMELKPLKIFTNTSGERIIDFGQNLVGWVKCNVSGKPGDSIVLYHAEALDKEGNFYTENLRVAKQKNVFILSGNPNEIFKPAFSFQGFRYVKAEGATDLLNINNVVAEVLYSDIEQTGAFKTSDTLLNKLQDNIVWSQRGNFLEVPTDCPQRDERLGWTGDAQVFFNTAAYNMNVTSFFKKWLLDMETDQFDDGSIPYNIPHYRDKKLGGSAGWGDAVTIIPWNYYVNYGDTGILRTMYPAMKKWVAYIRDNSENNLWTKSEHLGDWLAYNPDNDRSGMAAVTSKLLIAQAFYIHSLDILAKTAKVLGNNIENDEFQKEAVKARAAFVNEFMTASGRLLSNTQTAYVLALHFDILPEDKRPAAAKNLADNIKEYDNHITTGFLGTPYICEVLSRFGYDSVAYTLLKQETYPSWLYPVKRGATTIWERWDGIKPDGSFQTPTMNSFNHYAYGAIGEWMYRRIAGIKPLETDPGYKKFHIAPITGGGLSHAKGVYNSVYGIIKSEWNISGNVMKLEVTIPPNTSAEIHIPEKYSHRILLDNKEIKTKQVGLGSGNYTLAMFEKWVMY